jgi:hypothetical protein
MRIDGVRPHTRHACRDTAKARPRYGEAAYRTLLKFLTIAPIRPIGRHQVSDGDSIGWLASALANGGPDLRRACPLPTVDPISHSTQSSPLSRALLLSRTPRPPPFSSMNSTPALSKARLMTSRVARRGLVPASNITTPAPPSCARPRWHQATSPRS